MKYVVMLCDGMADYPVEELSGKTPLEVANTPNMDFLAKNGAVGLAKTVPDGMAPGSDTANLSVMGYDPKIYYTGRSPLEAVSMGIDLSLTDVTFRCNLVTLSDSENYEDATMVDYSAGEISTAESTELVNYLNELRLSRAAMLLTTTDTPVIEIAGMSGFNNISNFNRAFKMYYDTTPSKYRRLECQMYK